MEDVSTITSIGHQAVEQELKNRFDIILDNTKSDELWDSIWKFVEQFSNGNYRREM
jgi:hypothetical protein